MTEMLFRSNNLSPEQISATLSQDDLALIVAATASGDIASDVALRSALALEPFLSSSLVGDPSKHQTIRSFSTQFLANIKDKRVVPLCIAIIRTTDDVTVGESSAVIIRETLGSDAVSVLASIISSSNVGSIAEIVTSEALANMAGGENVSVAQAARSAILALRGNIPFAVILSSYPTAESAENGALVLNKSGILAKLGLNVKVIPPKSNSIEIWNVQIMRSFNLTQALDVRRKIMELGLAKDPYLSRFAESIERSHNSENLPILENGAIETGVNEASRDRHPQ